MEEKYWKSQGILSVPKSGNHVKYVQSISFKLRYCRLPLFKNDTINHRYMPTLGNGHIGATVYYPWLYLNGLFNGKGGRIH